MSATTSVDHEWSHDESTKSECRKAQEKSGEIGGAKKGCFWRGGGGGQNGTTEWSKETDVK